MRDATGGPDGILEALLLRAACAVVDAGAAAVAAGAAGAVVAVAVAAGPAGMRLGVVLRVCAGLSCAEAGTSVVLQLGRALLDMLLLSSAGSSKVSARTRDLQCLVLVGVLLLWPAWAVSTVLQQLLMLSLRAPSVVLLSTGVDAPLLLLRGVEGVL